MLIRFLKIIVTFQNYLKELKLKCGLILPLKSYFVDADIAEVILESVAQTGTRLVRKKNDASTFFTFQDKSLLKLRTKLFPKCVG